MTSKQMLKRIPAPKPAEVVLDWSPVPRTVPLLSDDTYASQSATLHAGKCPLCHAPIDYEVDKDQVVWFKCTKSPLYHEWRRSLEFLNSD